MFEKKQIILIPYWVQDVLRRNKMELVDCLSLDKLRPVMSQQDIAGFLALQDQLPVLLGLKDASVGSLYFAWVFGLSDSQVEVKDFLNTIVSPLSEDKATIKDLEGRLFTETSRQPHHKHPFISYDLTPGMAGMVVFPGFFGDTGTASLQTSLAEAMLKALYVYMPYNEVAKLPLFKRYLELLSGK